MISYYEIANICDKYRQMYNGNNKLIKEHVINYLLQKYGYNNYDLINNIVNSML